MVKQKTFNHLIAESSETFQNVKSVKLQEIGIHETKRLLHKLLMFPLYQHPQDVSRALNENSGCLLSFYISKR